VADYRVITEGTGYRLGLWQCSDPEPGAHEPERAALFGLIFPVTGAFVRERDGERELVDSTRVVFENAGEWYRIHHPVAGGDRCTVLELAGSLAEALAADLEPPRRRAVFERQAAPASARLYALHRELVSAARSPARDPLALDELSFTVMRLALRATRHTRRTARRASRHRQLAVQRALELIHADYRTPIPLASIARHAGYSPYHFARVFRERVGVSVHRYVTRLRLRACYEAVLDGECALTGLALSYGFASHSHFTHAFRREFGSPPSRMRRLHRASPATSRRA
jgi:AraC-like DNA-binding protein